MHRTHAFLETDSAFDGPIIMFQRASRSLPFSVARSMWAYRRLNPSIAIASAGGLIAGSSMSPRNATGHPFLSQRSCSGAD